MKVLTLTQPWAALIAIGAKQIETRSWYTDYRGPLAIHAAKGLQSVGGKRGFCDLVWSQPFALVLFPGWRDADNDDTVRAFEFGAIVATCELVCCKNISLGSRYGWHGVAGRDWEMTDQERAFGDYTPGRYAWLLANVRKLPEPIPCKGSLGLWNYEGVL